MKVSLIYLAAGNSRRFGSNKLLYEFLGKPMYRHLLDRLSAVCARHREWEVVVVTQYPEIARQVRQMGEQYGMIHTVFSPDSHKGASYSIRAGLEAAGAAEAGVFFVADQPYLSEKCAESFLEAMEKNRAGLGCVSWKGRRGNPVWFSRKYFPELARLDGDQGGRKVLERHLEDAVFFQVLEERELMDVDRPLQVSHLD